MNLSTIYIYIYIYMCVCLCLCVSVCVGGRAHARVCVFLKIHLIDVLVYIFSGVTRFVNSFGPFIIISQLAAQQEQSMSSPFPRTLRYIYIERERERKREGKEQKRLKTLHFLKRSSDERFDYKAAEITSTYTHAHIQRIKYQK